MVIQNFRTVDETGYLLLLMVVKGVQEITKIWKLTWLWQYPELSGGRIPLQNKYCHKSESAVIPCVSKVLHSHHDSSPWQVYSWSCHRSCWEGKVVCQHCWGILRCFHVYSKWMATEILEGWASWKEQGSIETLKTTK